MTGKIKAIIIDIDGCLTSTQFGEPLDLDSLAAIQSISQQYLHDPAVPMLVLNTGRDLTHSEMMAKIINAFRYLIIEAGAALVSVHGARITSSLHPSITREALKDFDRLYREFTRAHPGHERYLQQGKRYMISYLFDTGDPAKGRCAADLRSFIASRGWRFVVDEGHNFINVMFPGVDKCSGLDLLFTANPELDPGNVAGIGDSTGDWAFLHRCAFSATVANGSDDLKARVHYVARGAEARGTLEVIRRVIALNRVHVRNSQLHPRVPGTLVKAVITDINGTIDSAIFGNPLDMRNIHRIRELVSLAGRDPAHPRVHFNTGWDANYTILYAQLLGIPRHHVIERGAAIISIDGPFVRETRDPRITTDVVNQIAQLQLDFIETQPRYYENLQLGKSYTMSFQFEMGSPDMARCLADVRAFLDARGAVLDIEEGPNFFNVGVPGVDKGSGAAMLLGLLGDVDFSETCGIGDSDGDWAYMGKCGFTACPSNASRMLRERCDYVASAPETAGTLEILERVVEWNLARKV